MSDIVQLCLPLDQPTKRCTKCGEEKPLNAYYLVKRTGRLMANCKACQNAATRQWAKSHPQESRRYSDEWLQRNPEKRAETVRRSRELHPDTRKDHRERNREKIAAQCIAWNKANPDKCRLYERRGRLVNGRRDREKAYRAAHPELYRVANAKKRLQRYSVSVRDYTAQQWKETLQYFNGYCAYCGKLCDKLTQEHMQPLSRGGNHTDANIVAACEKCNKTKHARGLAQFLMLPDL